MGRKIWLFPLLAVMALCVGKAGCAKCALAEIFKNAKRGLFFLVSRLCPCPITLLVKSSQSSRKVVLCHDMSVVTRHCQCVRCLFLHVPQRLAYGVVADARKLCTICIVRHSFVFLIFIVKPILTMFMRDIGLVMKVYRLHKTPTAIA